MLQLQHAYIHLYHDDRVAPVHDQEYAAHRLAVPEGEKPIAEVTFRDRVAARLVANETEEVRMWCERYRRTLVEKGLSASAARQAGLAVGMRDAMDINKESHDDAGENGQASAAEDKRLEAAAEIQR